ncbi:hypothetical protein OZX69_03050 [Lactobacillus sp. ESL0731]|uniref:hypothetical protein n=1 Tax=unclassified Lactobacillus TaxID=2620435 RepID=UPI0023F8BE0C|nr:MULTISPECIES: hypothetical protein [unclassified Lactobacillus]WEV51687.1 hypothetical protein OZX63_03050 [Lactobacillus sp. ESL0700]WEV62816.1 hypothetical protein OZX69_03050 [Lactobacillus sp. ESL0731]
MYNGKRYDHLFYAGQKLMMENYLPRYFSFAQNNQTKTCYDFNVVNGEPVMTANNTYLGSSIDDISFSNYQRVIINQIVKYNGEDYALVRCEIHAYEYYTGIVWLKISDFGGATPL